MRQMLLAAALLVLATIAGAADNTVSIPQQGTIPVPVDNGVLLSPDAITIPRMLSYQGKLTDTLGNPVPNGSYSVVFRLYTVPSGGSSFWSETQNVQTADGLFAVLLGSVTPIATVPDAGALYLEMQVNPGPAMAPRVRIVSAAYAFKADSASYAAAASPAGAAGGDLTGTYPNPTIAGNAVTSAKILDGTIVTADIADGAVAMAKINQAGATTGQVIKWTGSAWAPRNDSVGLGGDNAWVRGGDSVLYTVNQLGIARGGAGNVLYGTSGTKSSHVNLGVACTTGMSGRENSYATVGGGYRNRALDTAAVVCGGDSNFARGRYSFVGGGRRNRADSVRAVVCGGYSNAAIGNHSAVVSGSDNTAFGSFSFVAGGSSNNVTTSYGQIGGGYNNSVSGYGAVVAGGIMNDADGGMATVAGGQDNTANGLRSTVGGGSRNRALDTAAVVCGGDSNFARGRYSFVGGGRGNRADSARAVVCGGNMNAATGDLSAVVGGYNNSASGQRSFVGGGYGNIASGYGATVAGGSSNIASGDRSSVGGGYVNNATAYGAMVAGGSSNTASGDRSFVGGGYSNTASGYVATVPGGKFNRAAGNHSLAAGTYARANHRGSFVWSDSSATASESVYTTGSDQFRVRARGGTWFFSNAGQTNGAYLAAGSNSWASACDSANKTDFSEVDRREILQKLAALRVREYRLRDQHDGTRHIGPVAQDFAAAFGVGENNTSINMADMDGVTLAAIQALYEKVNAQQAEIEQLKAELQKRR